MIDPNEPAFPIIQLSPAHGMSIRTYLAAQAMQGLLACSQEPNGGFRTGADLSKQCVNHADWLIDALNKPKEDKSNEPTTTPTPSIQEGFPGRAG